MSSIICRGSAHKTPSGPGGAQQDPRVSSSSYEPLSVLQGAHPPQKGHAIVTQVSMHIAPLISDVIYCLQGSRPQDTQWTRRSPTGPWGFQLWLQASVSPTGCPSPPARGRARRTPCGPNEVQQGPRVSKHHNILGMASNRQQMHRHHLQSPSAHPQKG